MVERDDPQVHRRSRLTEENPYDFEGRPVCRAGMVLSESLRNLVYSLDWQGIIDYVGLPCVIKDALGGGWKDVFICHSLEELVHQYDYFGLRTVIVQEFINWQQFVRCIALGQEEVKIGRASCREEV